MCNIIITLLLLTITCCKRDEIVQPTPSGSINNIEVIWTVPLNNQGNNYANLQPILYNNTLILGATPSNSANEIIYDFDKTTGQKLWQWNDYLSSPNYTTKINIKDNKAIISYSYRDYVFDLQTGSTLWRYETPTGMEASARGNVIGDHIYHPWDTENLTRDSIAWLMRSPVDYSHWDTVFTIFSENGYSVSLEPPVLWMSPTGDSVLIFQNRSFNFPLLDGRIDLLAFNLRTKQLNWRINDLTIQGNSSTHPPIIFNNQCFFLGDYSLYSINLSTGQKDWEYTVTGDPASNHLMQASCIVVNNKIYLKTTGGLFSCLDANTGQLIWKNDNAGFNPSLLNFYKDKLYYMADNKIYCVDANNGKVLYTFDSPNASRTDHIGTIVNGAGLVIDPVTNLMYFADSYYATCIKVPQ